MIMRRFILLSALILLLPSSYAGQPPTPEKDVSNDIASQKLWLTSDLQSLEIKAAKLGTPLARASAKAEIADAAWTLDQVWAKTLLRQAYELTLPDEEEQARLRSRSIGAPPTIPSANDVARNRVRRRVLTVASRDKAFVAELTQVGAQHLGKLEEHYSYANLAIESIEAGDNEAASNYILKAIEAEPTILNAGIAIFDMAARDRKAADKLIIQYMGQLRSVPLSLSDNSASRTYLFLRDIVFNNSAMYLTLLGKDIDPKYQHISPPGPDVMKAYITYMIESLGRLEQREPGSARRFRGHLMSAWLPLKQYAPELTGAFLELERLSRRPGGDSSLPTPESLKEATTERYEKQIGDSLNGNQSDALAINLATSKGDFDRARKMIDKLADGAQKTELIETVNSNEAISLATKGDTARAIGLAERLKRATSILQVYPVIINKCVTEKDQVCAINMTHQAMQQLRRADSAPPTPPVGMPAPVAATNRELDPVLLSFSKLAKAVASINETLAMELLDETVRAANASKIDTAQGRTGFEVEVFRKLAPKDENRVRQAASTLNDPLRQIVALAAIYQWKSEKLAKESKASVK
jgi:hypothetical protein